MAKQKRNCRPEADATENQAEQASGAGSRPGTPLVRTCLLFALILISLHAFTWLFALKGYIQWGNGTAHVVSAILNGMGIENLVDRNIIQLRNDTWNVTSECTAVNAVFLFVSFVLAYTARFKAKAVGLLAGIPLIISVNIVRLVALGWVTEYWPAQAHLFHDVVWQTVFVFFIVTLWFFWINMVVNREKTPAVPC